MRRGVENLFGIGLLHRHYDLAPNEKIVELGAVSSPRIIGDDEEIPGGTVLPHAWRVHEGRSNQLSSDLYHCLRFLVRRRRYFRLLLPKTSFKLCR